MKLEDVYYFSFKKTQQPEVYNLVQRTVDASSKDSQNAAELDRRLQLLTRTSGNEHIRQCSNFLAETVAFNSIMDAGHTPHWVPETKNPTPDIQYQGKSAIIPVEVKHLNSPHEEHEALASGRQYGGSVNFDYASGLQRKIEDFITSTRRKFKKHNEVVNNRLQDESGELYLFFSKSIDASLTDGIAWERTMLEKVTNIATPLCGSDVTLTVTDIDEQFR
jgi:hypothetical protein